mmetsp:Transcript_56700/g.151331  ORF Transcript_56700/g.151331 Transcript_56700/m.151331 type:complete len:287 (-) Transcript_56700:1405-2265(-)
MTASLFSTGGATLRHCATHSRQPLLLGRTSVVFSWRKSFSSSSGTSSARALRTASSSMTLRKGSGMVLSCAAAGSPVSSRSSPVEAADTAHSARLPSSAPFVQPLQFRSLVCGSSLTQSPWKFHFAMPTHCELFLSVSLESNPAQLGFQAHPDQHTCPSPSFTDRFVRSLHFPTPLLPMELASSCHTTGSRWASALSSATMLCAHCEMAFPTPHLVSVSTILKVNTARSGASAGRGLTARMPPWYFSKTLLLPVSLALPCRQAAVAARQVPSSGSASWCLMSRPIE